MAFRRSADSSRCSPRAVKERKVDKQPARRSPDAVAVRHSVAYPLTAGAVLDLQRRVGNRAVTAVVASGVVQRLNKKDKKTFRTWVGENLSKVKSDLSLGEKRNEKAQTDNYWYLKNYLNDLGLGSVANHVEDAAAIVREITGRALEIKEAAAPIDAGKIRDEALQEASDVSIEFGTEEDGTKVFVYLDNDQLKHQPPSEPIGTRQKGGGNKFKSTNASKDWHETNTLVHMRDWARELTGIAEGTKIYHGQATPVDGIHYEGYCLVADGVKYVLFHCYPANGSNLKL